MKLSCFEGILVNKKEVVMGNNVLNIVPPVISGIGVLLLLMAAFDVVPDMDNVLVFLAIACLIAAGVVKKITKGSCCK